MKLDFYEDPGHGWLKVPLDLLEKLGIAAKISLYSYQRGAFAYLEEDSDMGLFLDAAENKGIEVSVRKHFANKQSRIRGYSSMNSDRQFF
jgi:hypothetical protein